MTYIFRPLTLVTIIGYLALPFALAKKQNPVEDPKCPEPDNVNVTVFRDVYPGALEDVCFASFSSSWYWLQWSAWNDTILTSREAFKEIDGCMTIYTFDNPKQRALDGAIANWNARMEDNWWQNNARSPYCADNSHAEEPAFKRGGCTIEEGKY
jgi:hypothetical protein